jgi:hypothetical protein
MTGCHNSASTSLTMVLRKPMQKNLNNRRHAACAGQVTVKQTKQHAASTGLFSGKGSCNKPATLGAENQQLA